MYACVIEGADTPSCPDLDAFEELHVVSTEGDTVYGRMSASYIWWTDMLTIPIQLIISLASLLVSLLVTLVTSLAKSLAVDVFVDSFYSYCHRYPCCH
jgi:hypothetical protein